MSKNKPKGFGSPEHLAALRKGLAGTQGLVSELPKFAGLDFGKMARLEA